MTNTQLSLFEDNARRNVSAAARAARIRLHHQYNMLQFAIRNELYKQFNLKKQSLVGVLTSDIRYLSRKWHDDAEVLQKLQRLNTDT
jgi:hypothetical protein